MIVPVTVCIVALPPSSLHDAAATAAAVREVESWGVSSVRNCVALHVTPLCHTLAQVIVRSACDVLGVDAAAVPFLPTSMIARLRCVALPLVA